MCLGTAISFFYPFQWQKETKPSIHYLIYRVLLACYFVFVFVLSLIIADECGQLKFYAIYLTNWNVVLNAVYAVYGAVLVGLYYSRKIKLEEGENEMIRPFKVYWLLSVLSTSVSVGVSCFYWPGYNGRDAGVNDVLTHAGNSVVLLIDTFIIAHPPRFEHFIYPLGFSIFYAFVFSLPYTLLGGVNRDYKNFIYPSIDWNNNFSGAAIYSLIIVAVMSVVHLVVSGLAKIRVFVARKAMQ